MNANLRFDVEELAAIERAARAAGETVRAYIKKAVLEKARHENKIADELAHAASAGVKTLVPAPEKLQ